MSENEKTGANSVAIQIATQDLLRVIISDVYFSSNPAEFKAKIASLESRTVENLQSRRLFPDASDETEAYIKETASAYITKLLLSLRHAGDT